MSNPKIPNSIRLVDQFRQQHANFTSYYETWKAQPTARNAVNLAHTLGTFLLAANEVIAVGEELGNITVLREVDDAMAFYRRYWQELTVAADASS